jgi:hypothetical protein
MDLSNEAIEEGLKLYKQRIDYYKNDGIDIEFIERVKDYYKFLLTDFGREFLIPLKGLSLSNKLHKLESMQLKYYDMCTESWSKIAYLIDNEKLEVLDEEFFRQQLGELWSLLNKVDIKNENYSKLPSYTTLHSETTSDYFRLKTYCAITKIINGLNAGLEMKEIILDSTNNLSLESLNLFESEEKTNIEHNELNQIDNTFDLNQSDEFVKWITNNPKDFKEQFPETERDLNESINTIPDFMMVNFIQVIPEKIVENIEEIKKVTVEYIKQKRIEDCLKLINGTRNKELTNPQGEKARQGILKDLLELEKELRKLKKPSLEQHPNNELERIKSLKNQFWKGISMIEVIDHFKVMTEKKSNNGKPFLTTEQLILFLKKGFLNDETQLKQTINFSKGEKVFVVKRFYEFYNLCLDKGHIEEKESFLNQFLNCFHGWTETALKSSFKPNKTKQDW